MSATTAWWALMLARDPETWQALLEGEHVEPGRLDPKWLARAKTLRLVRLDKRAIELLFGECEEAREDDRDGGAP